MAVDLTKPDHRVLQPGQTNHVEKEKTWADRIVRALPWASAVLILLVAITTVVVLFVVSDSGATIDRVDTSSELQTCRAQFANERESIRAGLEAESARLSAQLATGLAAVVEDPVDQEIVAAVRAELPLLVEAVNTQATELVDFANEYDRILGLPERQFLVECERRFS